MRPGGDRSIRWALALVMLAALAGCKCVHKQKARWEAFRQDEETQGKVVAYLFAMAADSASTYLADPPPHGGPAERSPKPKPHVAPPDRNDSRVKAHASRERPSSSPSHPPGKPE